MKRQQPPADNAVEVDVVIDGRYEGRVVWLKLVGDTCRSGGLFPLTVPNALHLAYTLRAKLDGPRP